MNPWIDNVVPSSFFSPRTESNCNHEQVLTTIEIVEYTHTSFKCELGAPDNHAASVKYVANGFGSSVFLFVSFYVSLIRSCTSWLFY